MQGRNYFAEPKRNVLTFLHQILIWRATYLSPVEPLSNLKLGKYPGKKWKFSRTLQLAARLLRQGTKKNGTLAYDSDAARGLCKLQPGYPSKARRKMGRSRTTLMQHEDFASCSQATPARHEEKWDPRVRHSWSRARFHSKGEASSLYRYPILDIFFFVLMTRPISAFRLYRDFCARRTFSSSNIPFVFRKAYACW